jgi:glycosyltransferase involved in cell wall biosynthesis
MSKLSVYIISYNEENKIAAAVNSVISWADEVLVIDSYSTDRTAEIAGQLGATVIQLPFNGFGILRNEALRQCSHPWIFSLDADERCSPDTRQEILKIIREDKSDGPVAYFIPRRNYFLGRWIRYSGWYPDYRQPQLFKKACMQYTTDPVHEKFQVTGSVGKLRSAIWQFPFENLQQMLNKTNRYSTLGAEKLRGRKKSGFGTALLHGIAAFLQTYVIKRGFLDGFQGFVIALYNFNSTFYKYLKLAELQRDWKEPPAMPSGNHN